LIPRIHSSLNSVGQENVTTLGNIRNSMKFPGSRKSLSELPRTPRSSEGGQGTPMISVKFQRTARSSKETRKLQGTPRRPHPKELEGTPRKSKELQ
jgi:hypothetical protein